MNLRPAVAALDAQRQDAAYGEVEGEPRSYGQCDFEVKDGVVEPDESNRGEIARTYLYYAEVWELELTPEERKRYRSWDLADPPDDWKRERSRRIAQIQGVANASVEAHSDAASTEP